MHLGKLILTWMITNDSFNDAIMKQPKHASIFILADWSLVTMWPSAKTTQEEEFLKEINTWVSWEEDYLKVFLFFST